jgi:hypothetical protein
MWMDTERYDHEEERIETGGKDLGRGGPGAGVEGGREGRREGGTEGGGGGREIACC